MPFHLLLGAKHKPCEDPIEINVFIIIPILIFRLLTHFCQSHSAAYWQLALICSSLQVDRIHFKCLQKCFKTLMIDAVF